MSIDLIRQNAPILQQAAEQFTVGDVAKGKFSFDLVHEDVKEGVYHKMWRMNGSPPIPKFGTNRFNNNNGFSSTSAEKAQVIYHYLQEKGVDQQIRVVNPGNNLQESVNHTNGFALNRFEPLEFSPVRANKEYESNQRFRERDDSLHQLGEQLSDSINSSVANCTPEEHKCWGEGPFAGLVGFNAIVQIVDQGFLTRKN